MISEGLLCQQGHFSRAVLHPKLGLVVLISSLSSLRAFKGSATTQTEPEDLKGLGFGFR